LPGGRRPERRKPSNLDARRRSDLVARNQPNDGAECGANPVIVSHRKRFIFIANGKTGTTSIETVLAHLQEEERLAVPVQGLFFGKHVPASVLRELLGGEIWGSYFKFGFVRNPADRFLSVWRHYFKATQADFRRVMRHPRSALLQLGRARALGVAAVPARIEVAQVRHIVELQGNLKIRVGLDTNLQFPMFYDASGTCCADFIGKYETLAQDWHTIRSRIGMGDVTLPKLNAGAGHRDGVKFTAEARALLERVYAEDFTRFGYEFPAAYSD
jgi:hypothetical protein